MNDIRLVARRIELDLSALSQLDVGREEKETVDTLVADWTELVSLLALDPADDSARVSEEISASWTATIGQARQGGHCGLDLFDTDVS